MLRGVEYKKIKNKKCYVYIVLYTYTHTTLNAGRKCHVDKTSGQKGKNSLHMLEIYSVLVFIPEVLLLLLELNFFFSIS